MTKTFKGFIYGVAVSLLFVSLFVAFGPDPKVIGLSAQCQDGYYTTAKGRGTCAAHGGVERYIIQ